ncbi:MAG: undecaprenyl-phosphate glucose phosphotransferase [Lachnospiraceae bacterium]|jgi:Undecaprenyl-phosphate glucose phosphotransferase|nr:undecaprenyl-phosphate glucose phosphotransferase [Lachnospiraceae bacterium]MBQ6318315.1 undecaprenyl-phosphate glucose phosphotransferase [Lachnospiraceae bacterium]
MIRDNQRLINRLTLIIDGFVIVVSYLFAYFLKFESGLLLYDEGLSVQTYMTALYFLVPGYLILYSKLDLYSTRRASGRKRELLNVIKANTLGALIFMMILYLINQPDFSRQMIFIFWGVCICLETAVRNMMRALMMFWWKKGYNLKYVLLIGYSGSAESYINKVLLNPQWGYVIRGILDDNVERGTEYKGIKVLGTIDNLSLILPENKLDEIAITLPLGQYGRLKEIVGLCEKSGVHTKFIPDYAGVIPNRPYTEDIQGLPVINIRRVPLNNTINSVVKRLVDIVGSAVGIVLASPIMIVSAILIKATSDGPVIFSQERVGLHNKPFKMYKFRTMIEQTEAEEAKGWTTKDDPRVTKIGRFLRRTSLDELPQLFNIFIGQMSLVGPRPERPQFVEKFREEIPRYMIKHQVRPGLTGWAQINGLRGDTSIEKRIEHDLYYIENWTLEFDIKILLLTVFRGFINKNAY